jgi:UDP-N-acetylmuramate dehydrogenase
MAQCLTDFLKEQDVEFYELFEMSKISSIGIGGKAQLFVSPNTEEKLISLIDFLVENDKKYIIVGRMTNILPCDTEYSGVLISTLKINTYNAAEMRCTVSCGTDFSKLLYSLSFMGYGGMEELFGIPGSVGGMIFGNAGAYGKSVSDFITDVTVYDPLQKTKYSLDASEMGFAYRESIVKHTRLAVLSANLTFSLKGVNEIKVRLGEIISQRKSSQPYGQKSLGSIFKRSGDIPISRLIDSLGLKGLRIGGAEISEKHAGFIVNAGGATAKDVRELIKIVKNKIFSAYGIEADEEIQFMK